RLSWGLWQKRWCQSQVYRGMESQALRQWAHSVELRAWVRWKALYVQLQREMATAGWAARRLQHWAMRKALKTWLQYMDQRREKQRSSRECPKRSPFSGVASGGGGIPDGRVTRHDLVGWGRRPEWRKFSRPRTWMEVSMNGIVEVYRPHTRT
ncbi:hypothetical protein Chor_000035, partial [Crotalus horridus]